MIDYSLYLVSGRYNFDEKDFLFVIEEAVKNGVSIVQLREKQETTRYVFDLAAKVKKITDQYQVPLIINDRIDICIAVDAAGIHIGDDELPVSVVRNIIGPEKILGVSVKTVEKALEAENAGADYLGVGAIFPTQTKQTQLTSIKTLKDIKSKVEIPVVAIGGIKERHISHFSNTNIDGIAVVSEIMNAKDVSLKAESLRRAIDKEIGGDKNGKYE